MVRPRHLLEIRHVYPSSLDPQSFAASGGFPKEFLQGVGLTPWQQELISLHDPGLSESQVTGRLDAVGRARLRSPGCPYPVFLLGSADDEKRIQAIHQGLEQQGILCWRAVETVDSERFVDRQLDREIRSRGVRLLYLSPAGLSSEWLQQEFDEALRHVDSGDSTSRSRIVFLRACPTAELVAWPPFQHPGRDPEKALEQFPQFDLSDSAQLQTQIERIANHLCHPAPHLHQS